MRRCLVVDDSRVIRKVARRILEDMRFEIEEAADGLDAILLDWTMPVMSGIDFLKQLRQEPNGDKPTVVFCTTENDVERISEALKAGADEYMMKPFDGDILHSKFAEAGLV
jgi:two-component system chemotaxis response regulator CheY